ncbi:MAG TPA: protein kinase family protein [Cryptosporangiaceae bacterium]|nr:protein kinase family protein [Cryptosporangiaceae bacterium]
MTQLGAPTRGEVLAGRYRLDDIVSADPASGHAFWRGTDSLLNRPVSIELRVPGGPAAKAMIAAAVTAGRIVHPSVVGVYDAVDEGPRAFVVREWVEGETLLAALRDGPLDPARAAAVVRTAADALAGIHATGHAHGNLQPEAVLIGVDGEVTLTDLRLGDLSAHPLDVRGIGGLLYAALTGHWPADLPPHRTGLPPAVLVDGRTCSPRQFRAGIPAYLDALTMDLLDPAVPPPPAAELAGELRRYDIGDPGMSTLGMIAPEPAPPERSWRRAAVLGAGLAVIVGAGLLVGTLGLPDFGGSNYPPAGDPTRTSPTVAATPAAFRLTGATVVDGRGTVDEVDRDAGKTTDGNAATVWRTDEYNAADLLGFKKGMGIVVDLGEVRLVRRVSVGMPTPGATLEIRLATEESDDPADYEVAAAEPTTEGDTVVYTLATPTKAQYVLVFITSLPSNGEGKYQLGISEIKVSG